MEKIDVGYWTFEILVLRGIAMIIRLLLRSPGAVSDERLLEDIKAYAERIEKLNVRTPSGGMGDENLLEDIADCGRSELKVEAQPPAGTYPRLEYRRPYREDVGPDHGYDR